MCGRFTIASKWEAIKESFGEIEWDEEWIPRFNVAPSQKIPVLTDSSPKRLSFFRWGLVPFWAKDEKIGYKMINARAETLDEKPSFKGPLKSQRCLVIADGFYEWKKEAGGKTPWLIRLRSQRPFAFAGLWERWDKGPESPLYSCTIITTESNSLVADIHHRMPVILPMEHHSIWLDSTHQKPVELKSLLRPFDSEEMECYPVSKRVNDPKNDVAECLIRA